ncbi:MAG TPA: lysophospholipid acyltransferase family protein [Acidimicrobiia bacterium]|nr:lysophospholipid acyltransferase family protein [Acidimicrobiia bacterium]
MASSLPARLRGRHVRRAISVPLVATSAGWLAASAGIWAPAATALDLVTDRHRMARLRTISFALAWSGLETIGVAAATTLWAAGRTDDREAHYALQRWWASRLVDAIGLTTGLRMEVDGGEHLAPGPVVVCARHASIADALLPAWLLGRVGMHPRFVLKDELLLDPCLDIVGNRVPNHFIDRDPSDAATELVALEELAQGMGARDAAVIFPEGTTASASRRERAIERIRAREPQRLADVTPLSHVLPVRPSGIRTLLAAAPHADLAFVAHHGFEALDPLLAVPGRLPLRLPVRVRVTRVARAEVPEGEAFVPWFDRAWIEVDQWVRNAAGGG